MGDSNFDIVVIIYLRTYSQLKFLLGVVRDEQDTVWEGRSAEDCFNNFFEKLFLNPVNFIYWHNGVLTMQVNLELWFALHFFDIGLFNPIVVIRCLMRTSVKCNSLTAL